MTSVNSLNLAKYKLVIIDWDGTLIDSSKKYKELDKLFVRHFYNSNNISELSKLEYKCVSDDWRDHYYKKIDEIYADGRTPMDKIYRHVNKYKKIVQSEMHYMKSASVAISKLKKNTDLKLVIATNSNIDDMEFFSSSDWHGSKFLNPKLIFDMIVTIDEVSSAKPHPEIFKRIIDYYNVNPSEVLVIEDDARCMKTAKEIGADVLAFYDKNSVDTRNAKPSEYADYVIYSWNDLIKNLFNSKDYFERQMRRMDNPTVHDYFIWQDEWQDADYYDLQDKDIPGIQWTGVYCFGNLDGKIPIVNYADYPSGLPGGHIDDGDLSINDTLSRELAEEINCTVLDWVPVGYKIIIKPDKNVDYQLFVYANLQKNGNFVADMGGLVSGYTLHDISELNSKIEWNKTSDWLQENLAKYYQTKD
ncbi:MAG: HAD-IA family hydrolase [Candidatus Saccharibacteria bacterium]